MMRLEYKWPLNLLSPSTPTSSSLLLFLFYLFDRSGGKNAVCSFSTECIDGIINALGGAVYNFIRLLLFLVNGVRSWTYYLTVTSGKLFRELISRAYRSWLHHFHLHTAKDRIHLLKISDDRHFFDSIKRWRLTYQARLYSVHRTSFCLSFRHHWTG